MPATATQPLAILPDAVYTRTGFKTVTGLCEHKLREAKQHGIEPRKFWIGKRCFHRGKDVIEFLEMFSADEANRKFATESDGK
jgi:hypothetical protein